jgi:hypothetical protein
MSSKLAACRGGPPEKSQCAPPHREAGMLKVYGAMTSSHELASAADPVLPAEGRLSVPAWVISAIGAAIVIAGLAYFVVQARRGRLRR